MRALLKVTRVITLLTFLITLSYVQSYAQNTAPVPTTFEILSPADGNFPFQINTSYGTATGKNHRIFYGGDFASSSVANSPFLGFTLPAAAVATGNLTDSRLTLGGTASDIAGALAGVDIFAVANLPGIDPTTNVDRVAAAFDDDDAGGAAGVLDYHGANGFIAINEEDSLVIRLTGYVDPNNTLVTAQGVASDFSGANMKSMSYAFDLAHPSNDSANGVKYGVVPSTLPAGANFNGGIFTWVPNFIQGDGATDNSVRGGRFFVDANISSGATASETATRTALDTVSEDATVHPTNHQFIGRGKGELKDSLYVILFTATDDGIPSKVGTDSLFIMVNDSIANPAPIITKREVINRQGLLRTYTKSSVQFASDSLLHYSEGDSIVITYYAVDQDSARGEINDVLDYSVVNWSNFIHRASSHIDSMALDTVSIKTPGTPGSFRVRLKVAFNVGDTATSDTLALVVKVHDSSGNDVPDTMLFRIANVNRAPIWDSDTSSKPTPYHLVYSLDPGAVDADSINDFLPIAVANGRTDSITFTKYIYDPDVLIGDSLGNSISYSQVGSPSGATFLPNGLMVLLLTSTDTTSYPFTIKGTDSFTPDPKTGNKVLILRVAPEPLVASVYPYTAYPGQNITLFGSGFGLYDEKSTTPSKVTFRARNSSGVAQNLVATINSWGRDRINLTVPAGAPVTKWDITRNIWIPDTIQVNSAVFNSPTYYPFVISEYDSTRVTQFELANLSSTSVRLKWETAFSGIDSVVVATEEDTLHLDDAGVTVPFNPVFKVTTSQVNSAAQVYHGATTSTDQLHYVTITDLVPNKVYRFFLGMSNGYFFGDTSGRVNGPYKPAKINRTSPTFNNGIKGFKFKTLPTQSASGETFVVEGDAYTGTGAAVNSIVTVKVVDYQNVSDTALALTSIVQSDSSWFVNLGNAVTDTFDVPDRVFHHKQGDYLIVTIEGGAEIGTKQFTTTRGASTPQRIDFTATGIRLAPVVNYDMRLKVGLNLVGLPVELFVGEPANAEALLNRIAGGLPSITRYVPATGTQETIARAITGTTGRGFIGAENFNLALFQGYFVKTTQEQYVTLNGSLIGDSLGVQTFQNAAYYWISRPAQSSNLFFAWSAKIMLANIANLSEIFRYNEEDQHWESGYIEPISGAFGGDDFHIDVSEGYVLNITAASQWDPNTPASLLLANASAKFDNLTENMPSLTLNTANATKAPEGASATLRGLTLTDVTSSAATLSWLTDVNGKALVRYGKAGESLNQTAEFDSKSLDGAMRMVQLLKLEAETEYNYEVVINGTTYNNNGQPFTFTSAKVGTGLPYTVFGRLLDESGNPLSKALVYVELKNKDEVSLPLLAVTDAKGYWDINLANFKKTADGEVFPWNVGNEILVNAIFQNASIPFRTLVSGASPQNVVKASDLDAMVAAQKKETARVALPKAFALAQNYPNPFNPSTTISYDIPDSKVEGVGVELKVYNLRGQLIRSLVNEVKQPGQYVIQWNGRDEKGDMVSSGVYFYRIKAGDFTTTRKMVLLK
ncbi:T9SS type A sorting domain-containing protein [bacterium]|nr:T9SS type A sorting domain-containing protein [bacterium]